MVGGSALGGGLSGMTDLPSATELANVSDVEINRATYMVLEWLGNTGISWLVLWWPEGYGQGTLVGVITGSIPQLSLAGGSNP